MIHGCICLLAVLIVVVFKLPVAFMFFLPMFYLGREHAQAEYRYIASHGGKRANCPWYCGFLPSAWTVKGILDFTVPFLVSFGYVLLMGMLWVL